ncbi:MAG TPA: HupE/UreJ family protein [Burkholderiales bacterium]|nr:HupE/UreJ family protein [Burkholderiales bacterium]
MRLVSILRLWPLLFFWVSLPAVAHEIRPAVVTVTFEQDRYRVEINTNMEAVLAGVSPRHKDTTESPQARDYDSLRQLPPAALAQRIEAFQEKFLEGIDVDFDGVHVKPDLHAVEIPEVGDLRVARLSTVKLSGAIPEGAKVFRWRYAAEFGDNVVRLRAGVDGKMEAVWLKEGDKSEPYVLGEGLKPRTRAEIAWQYTQLGFTHILPYGLDHILFVLGLFLLSVRWKPLLIQVTSFTVAHSITLGLSIYGVFSLPPTVVEPLIAASIVYVAVENVITSRLHAWRPFVVFGFGLLHGMGFAGVLHEVGLPRAEFVTGLITFNLGVEFGQLAVITLAFGLVGFWGKDKPWYRPRVVIPVSALIALVGAYWTVERVL